MKKQMIVTGSSGLIGSEVCTYFEKKGWQIHGVDNNQRREFFGQEGDTSATLRRLQLELKNFSHNDIDIRDRSSILDMFKRLKPNAIVHCAAQPSHDLAAKIPFEDFDTNAVGTLNLLEGTRKFTPDSPFVFLSTNKVYGDGPNRIKMTQTELRYEYAEHNYKNGISEGFPIDQCTHSIFGVSKTAADLLTQEYGRYFNIPTCTLRGGCLTGPTHSGVELHGFLSYLTKCNVSKHEYTIFGHNGKQVRDNIHSIDVARFISEFIDCPRAGEVYNIGGGKDNTCSILEAIASVESLTQIKMKYKYSDKQRIGDHICYYTDLSKAKSHYPKWDVTVSLKEIYNEIATRWKTELL